MGCQYFLERRQALKSLNGIKLVHRVTKEKCLPITKRTSFVIIHGKCLLSFHFAKQI